MAPVAERAGARHELAGGIADFLAAASRLLSDGGRCYLIFLAERMAELLALMHETRLEPKRLRMVHGRIGDGARMVLVEGRKRGRPGLWVGPPLLIYDGKDYSSEVRSIYGEEGS
jgi:tRNA1Val (adenine37-N6)-methyltransferase